MPLHDLREAPHQADELAGIVLAQLAQDPRHVVVDTLEPLPDLQLALVGQVHDHAAVVGRTRLAPHQAPFLKLVEHLRDACARHLAGTRQLGWRDLLGVMVQHVEGVRLSPHLHVLGTHPTASPHPTARVEQLAGKPLPIDLPRTAVSAVWLSAVHGTLLSSVC